MYNVNKCVHIYVCVSRGSISFSRKAGRRKNLRRKSCRRVGRRNFHTLATLRSSFPLIYHPPHFADSFVEEVFSPPTLHPVISMNIYSERRTSPRYTHICKYAINS